MMNKFFSSLRSGIMSNYFLRNSFPRKLTCAFLGATMIPLIIISLIFYKINAENSYEKVADATYLTNQQLVLQIESRFTQMEKAADTLQSYMYAYPTKEDYVSSEQITAFNTLRTNVLSLINTFDFMNICIFLNNDSIFNTEGLTFYSLDRLSDFQISTDELIQSNTESTWLFVENQTYPFMLNYMLDRNYEPVDAVNCIRMLKNTSEKSLHYVFFISVDTSEFTELLNATYNNTEITGYLIDKDKSMVVSSGTEETQESVIRLLDEHPEFAAQSASFSDQSSLYYMNRLSNGWIYVTCVPQNYIRADAASYVRTFLIVLCLVIPFAAAVVILLTKSFTRRITLLSASAGQANFNQNQFHAPSIEYVLTKPEKNYDEVDQLAAAYNHLLKMLQENIDNITALRAQEESLKYQLLQSRINPHFLYNILDSVLACNAIGKPELANKLITNLTRFYRMTLRKSNELITIHDEMEIALLYMEMESICRGGNFTWDIALDEEIENFMICKFTLQPFIENSIRHGMQGSSQKLHIQIEIRYGDDTILIYIRDNGHGIAPEKLKELRESLKSHMVDTSKHFGICNVNARISSELFGHGFIEIDSEPEKGTTVKIEFQQILP